jgi:hypothetical protein
MGNLIETVRPILAEHGMSLAHETNNDLTAQTVTVTTILGHEAGYERRNEVTLPLDTKAVMGEQQRFGSAMTYAQRYSTMTALGLAATDDDDARSAGVVSTRVTAQQIEDIRTMLTAANSSEDKLLDFLRKRFKRPIAKLEDLYVSELSEALALRSQKQQRQKS